MANENLICSTNNQIEKLVEPINKKLMAGEINLGEAMCEARKVLGLVPRSYEDWLNFAIEPIKYVTIEGWKENNND